MRCTMGVVQQAFSEATYQADGLMGQFQNASASSRVRDLCKQKQLRFLKTTKQLRILNSRQLYLQRARRRRKELKQ